MRILWKIIKVLGNIFGVLTSIVVSLALLVMLVATPLVSGVSAFTKPETVRKVIEEIDFKKIITDGLSGMIDLGDSKELAFFTELTESNAFGELLELYVTDLTGIFDTQKESAAVTEDALRDILENNMDELVEILRRVGEYLGEDPDTYSDEELEEKIREFFNKSVDKFIELAPTAEDLQKLITRVIEEFSTMVSGSAVIPNNGMLPTEDDYFEWGEDSSYEGGGISYGGDGNFISGNIGEGMYYGIVDPETGEVVYYDSEGNVVNIVLFPNGGAVSGGIGSPVAIHTMLFMSLTPDGGASSGTDAAQGVMQVLYWFLTLVQNGTATLFFAVVTVLLALLLCLLRWPRFKGVMWLAIVLLLGGIFLGAVAAVIAFAPAVLSTVVESMGFAAAIPFITAFMPVASVFTEKMFIAAAVYAGAAILLIILFIIFRVILKKRKKAKAAKAKAKAMEAIADDAEANAIAAKAEAQPEPEEVAAEEEEELEEKEVPSEEESPEGIAAE